MSLVLFTASCSSISYIAPKENKKEGVTKIYYKGKQVAISYTKNSTLAFWGKEKDGEIILSLLFKNRSDHPINFFPKMVTIYGVDDSGELEDLETYNPHEYLDKLRTKQAIALALQGLGNAFQAYARSFL